MSSSVMLLYVVSGYMSEEVAGLMMPGTTMVSNSMSATINEYMIIYSV